MLPPSMLNGLEEITAEANELGVSVAHLSIKRGLKYHKKEESWPDVVDALIDESAYLAELTSVSNRNDLATRLARSLHKTIQFPRDTAFLHVLGCIACAMSKSFKFDYWGSYTPVNMYVVTAQPPSSGKSKINNVASSPIMDWYIERNKETEADRMRVLTEIKKLEHAKDVEPHEFVDRMAKLQDELKFYREWQLPITDSTIEACESSAAKQEGLFNIISAESDAANVIVGASYGDTNKKQNQGLLLSGWDGEFVRSVRVTRTGFSGYATGSIAIIAQAESIDSILEAGASGRGLAERFFLLREPEMLGSRDFASVTSEDRANLKKVGDEYARFIKRVMDESEVILTFDQESNDYIRSIVSHMEPLIGPGGKYSNNLMTGLVGKMDKHIRKIACVFHCLQEWGIGGNRSTVVTFDQVGYAGAIFQELIKTFERSSSNLGYSGASAEVEKVKDSICKWASKGKLTSDIRNIRDSLKAVKPFKTSRNVTKSIRSALAQLEKSNHCIVHNDKVYFNPRLK